MEVMWLRRGEVAGALLPVPIGPWRPTEIHENPPVLRAAMWRGHSCCRAEIRLGACWSANEFNAGEGVFEAAASALMPTRLAGVPAPQGGCDAGNA